MTDIKNKNNMVQCYFCGCQYDLDIHNWCPNCRKTYDGSKSYTKKYVTPNTPNTPNTHQIINDVNDTWEVKIDVINNCSKSPENIKVKINPIVKSKIDYLMKKFIGTEWLAYLIGEEDREGKKAEENKVVDIFLPNQVVNSVNVDNIHCKEFNNINIIGVIHSHHDMGNNFSSTDDEWINQNHNISLCVSKSGIKGHVRWKTPCGSYKIVEAKLVLNFNSNFDKNAFDKEIDEKIKKKTFNQVKYSNCNHPYPYNHVYTRTRTRNCVNNYPQVSPGHAGVVDNNPGSYHFTDTPTMVKKDNQPNFLIDDHISEDEILKAGEDLYDEIIKDLEFNLKDV